MLRAEIAAVFRMDAYGSVDMGKTMGQLHRRPGGRHGAAGVHHQTDAALRQRSQQGLPVRVELVVVIVGVGVKQHGGPSVQADLTQPGVRHILGLQLPQPVHMGRAQVDLLLFL